MTDKDELEGYDEGKTWGAKFPRSLAERMTRLARRHGYPAMSEFIRDACRKHVMYLETRSHKKVVDLLIAGGKITPMDLRDALYAMNEGPEDL